MTKQIQGMLTQGRRRMFCESPLWLEAGHCHSAVWFLHSDLELAFTCEDTLFCLKVIRLVSSELLSLG